MYHEHPLRILRYSAKNIWLLLFPLLRGIQTLHFDPEGAIAWLRGAWFDILVLGVILLFGWVRWYFSWIDITDKAIVHRGGVIFRVRTAIPVSSISVAIAEYPLLLIPFRGVRFSCDTRAGIFKSIDMKLLVTRKVASELMNCIPEVSREDKLAGLPRANVLSVLLFSVFFSSGFSGAVYIAAFMFKGGDIARNIITRSLNRLTETTSKLTFGFIRKIPATAVAVGIFFIAAWTLSFVVNLMRYSRFNVESDQKSLNIGCGVINRRIYRITSDHINYTDLRQNLIMKLFGAVTVNINCAGYGADSQHLPVLMPIKREKDLGRRFEPLGVLGVDKLHFKPSPAGFGSYLFLPAVAALVIFPLSDWLTGLFPRWAELSLFAAIMLEIPVLWLITVKMVALLTSGVYMDQKKIVFRCSHWTAFHTVIADKENVVQVRVYQSFLQKFSRRCNLCVWFCGESTSKYYIRALRLRDGIRIVKLLGHDIR